MKRLGMLALAVILTCMLCAGALADTEITVIGTATVTLDPDQAEVTFTVRTTKQTAAEAASENAARVEKVISALKETGIEEKEIVTARYSVGTEYDWEKSPAEITGYTVSNSLTVSLKDIDQLGSVIDTGLSAGADECGSIRYRSSASETAYDQALRGAIAEGRRKAELAAEAAGLTLGKLETMTENYGSYAGATYAANDMDVEEAGGARFAKTVIMADTLSFSATVTMTYEAK